jgi:hypothetical protein
MAIGPIKNISAIYESIGMVVRLMWKEKVLDLVMSSQRDGPRLSLRRRPSLAAGWIPVITSRVSSFPTIRCLNSTRFNYRNVSTTPSDRIHFHENSNKAHDYGR